MKRIISISKYILAIVGLGIIGTCCNKAGEAHQIDVNIMNRVDRFIAIDAFIDQKIQKLKHGKLAGDAEVGVRGGSDLYLAIKNEAEERFPKNEEYFFNKYDINKGGYDIIYSYWAGSYYRRSK